MKDDGGPAFPTKERFPENGDAWVAPQPGMSLRDWFAGMALQGDLAGQNIETGYYNGETWERDAARNAYKIADAMLAARKEQQ